jgi:hypothetical protein
VLSVEVAEIDNVLPVVVTVPAVYVKVAEANENIAPSVIAPAVFITKLFLNEAVSELEVRVPVPFIVTKEVPIPVRPDTNKLPEQFTA